MCNYHVPVCLKCEVGMKMDTVGVTLLDQALCGAKEAWQSDVWKCPNCRHEVVTGFGCRPVARHHDEEDLTKIVASAEKNGLLVKCYEMRSKV